MPRSTAARSTGPGTPPTGPLLTRLAHWTTREGADAFFTEWQIDDEPGEVAIRLEGDVGLVALG